MKTSMTGTVARVLEEEIRLKVGAIEYQVLVPELVRRSVQTKIGEETTLHTIEFFEGNPTRGRIIPRIVGFLSEPELEFFNLFCTVDGVGVRTALKAMVRQVRDVADMIQRQDTKLLATLPGISNASAERVVAKLRKKVTKFALMVDRPTPGGDTSVTSDVAEEAFQALLSVGHSDSDARELVDRVLASGKKCKSVPDLLTRIYEQE